MTISAAGRAILGIKKPALRNAHAIKSKREMINKEKKKKNTAKQTELRWEAGGKRRVRGGAGCCNSSDELLVLATLNHLSHIKTDISASRGEISVRWLTLKKPWAAFLWPSQKDASSGTSM